MSLRDYQQPVLLDLFTSIRKSEGGTFTVMFPRQSGKNEVAAFFAAALALAPAGGNR